MRPLARWCFIHRRIVAAAWVAGMLSLTAIHSAAGSAYSDSFRLPGTQSFEATRLLERSAPKAAGDTELIVIAVAHGRVTDPRRRARAEAMLAAIARLPYVAQIYSPYRSPRAAQIAPGGQVAFATVVMRGTSLDLPAAARFVDTARSASARDLEIEVEGHIAQAATQTGEGGLRVGFLAAGIVLFVAFGSLLAMVLPLVTAGLSLGTGIAVIGLLSHLIQMASFTEQLSLLLGLGVGVDYALFILARYRQGALRGLSGEHAVEEAAETSGRAVLFAGAIVCIAMFGMFALGVSFLYGVAIAVSVVVALSVIAALTLLPALLGFFGVGVLRRRERRLSHWTPPRSRDERGNWARWADRIQQHPAAFAAGATALMVVIAVPFLSMRVGAADAGSDRAGSTTRMAYDLLARGFGPGYNGPLELVAQTSNPAQQEEFARIEDAVASTAGVAAASPPQVISNRDASLPRVALADIYPRGSPQDASTERLLQRVRNEVNVFSRRGGVRVLVGGQTAIFEDFNTVLSRKLPVFFVVVLGLSYLLLMIVLRSLLIPLIAVLMNFLTAAAAFGIVTAIFQHGLGASLLGIDRTAPIDAFVPVFLFAILFGLSTDYELFLVTRINEEWHRRADNRDAVRYGLVATGRTITTAAAIMVVVFCAFILAGGRIIELFGVGLGSAVILDAVIVRSILVPALMLVLGDANWRLPNALDRVLPHLSVDTPPLYIRTPVEGTPVEEPEPEMVG